MYIVFPYFGIGRIKKIHRKYSKHHLLLFKTDNDIDYVAAMLDWECCRFTKPDEPMSAREYLEYTYRKNKITKTQYIKMVETLNLYKL